MGAKWGRDLAPRLDLSHLSASLEATSVRPSVLLPFVSTLFTELEGRVDAHVKLDVDLDANKIQPQGTVTLKDGVIELAAMGSELHDVGGQAHADPRWRHQARRPDRARGLTGRVVGAASARFDGRKFAGARGTVKVALAEAGAPAGGGRDAGGPLRRARSTSRSTRRTRAARA